jgi:lipoyl(octanoyl) transferase
MRSPDCGDGAVVERVPAAAGTVLRRLGLVEYVQTVEAMRSFTETRGEATADELWLLQHSPVYTLGQGADPSHGPRVANGIPVVRTGRGGEITYHGPGQLVVYTLVDLTRKGLGVREFVRLLESALIEMLGAHGVTAERKTNAPGVYVAGAKVAALGIRVTRGRTWHGLSLNVNMDLSPFSVIDPCGHAGQRVTQLRDLGITEDVDRAGEALAPILMRRLKDA